MPNIWSCDFDLTFGSIDSFFTAQIRNSADLFTITPGYHSGALTIFRNNEKMLRLYQRAKGWKYIFQDSRHFAFDESLRIKETVSDKEDKESYCLISFSDLVLSAPDISVANNRYIGYGTKTSFGYLWSWTCLCGWGYIFIHYVVTRQPVWGTLSDWKNSWQVLCRSGLYITEKRPVQFPDLRCKSYYRGQVFFSMRKKWEIIKM